MKRAVMVLAACMLLVAAPGFAQEEPSDTRNQSDRANDADRDGTWSFWLKGNGQIYENFFQATEGNDEETVLALFGEAGANLRLAPAVTMFGQVNYITFDEDGLGSSPGLRVGVRGDARPHAYSVFVEQLFDRPTFDVGDEYDRADTRTIAGEYSFRFADDWQVGAEGELQQQEFDVTTNRDNDFHSLGASLRWRGSRLFSPEIGFRTGTRDVDDDVFSYDQRDVYLQIRSALTERLYLSGRIRDRRRDYTTDREDERRQLMLSADYTLSPALVLNLYAADESVDVNREGRDFDTRFWMAGVTWKF